MITANILFINATAAINTAVNLIIAPTNMNKFPQSNEPEATDQ